jgi:NADH-quinone oxidoreductase subunit M
VTAAFGALSALTEKDLRKLVACATTAQAGFILLGAGSLTPQGMSGAIVTASARALACAVLLLLAGAIDDRVRTRDVTRLEGIAAQMPGYATALATAALGQAGVLGLGGAWGPLLALLGALPNYAPLAIASGIALAVLAASHLFTVARVAFGRLDPAWEKSPYLEPFGGRFPDLSPREWTSIAPLATLVVMLGVWPAPLLAVTTGTAKDLAGAVSPPGEGPIAIALR